MYLSLWISCKSDCQYLNLTWRGRIKSLLSPQWPHQFISSTSVQPSSQKTNRPYLGPLKSYSFESGIFELGTKKYLLGSVDKSIKPKKPTKILKTNQGRSLHQFKCKVKVSFANHQSVQYQSVGKSVQVSVTFVVKLFISWVIASKTDSLITVTS